MAASKALLYIDYIGGYFILGLAWYIYDGILPGLNLLTPGTDLYIWCDYMWKASLVMYIIFGTFYFFKGLKEYEIDIRR